MAGLIAEPFLVVVFGVTVCAVDVIDVGCATPCDPRRISAGTVDGRNFASVYVVDNGAGGPAEPRALNFNVDQAAVVPSSMGGVSTEEILQARSPSWASTLRLGARGA